MKPAHTKCWQRLEDLDSDPLLAGPWNLQPLWKVWCFLKSYTATPLSGLHPRERTYTSTQICSATAEHWQQPQAHQCFKDRTSQKSKVTCAGSHGEPWSRGWWGRALFPMQTHTGMYPRTVARQTTQHRPNWHQLGQARKRICSKSHREED